jgi:hypothetical protein
MSERLIFSRSFSDGSSCNVEIAAPLPNQKELKFGTQNAGNEFEQWFTKEGEREPYRLSERLEHHDVFHEYRDWFVSVIIPAAAEKWKVQVTGYIVGWRPHQQEWWRCKPGEKPEQLAVFVDPETGKPAAIRRGDDGQPQMGRL